jgi:hypothetical protein
LGINSKSALFASRLYHWAGPAFRLHHLARAVSNSFNLEFSSFMLCLVGFNFWQCLVVQMSDSLKVLSGPKQQLG